MKVDIQGVGTLDVPDDATQDEIQGLVDEHFPLPKETPTSTLGVLSDTANHVFTGSLLRGIDNLQSSLYGVGAVGAKVLGAEKAQDWFVAGYLRNVRESQANPPLIPSYRDIFEGPASEAPSRAATYAIEGIMENLPSMLPSLVTGGGAAMLARAGTTALVKELGAEAAAKVIASRAAAAGTMGALGANVAQETGSIAGDIYEKTGQIKPTESIVGGTLAGAVETAADLVGASQFVTAAEKKVLAKWLGEGLTKEVEGRLARRVYYRGGAGRPLITKEVEGRLARRVGIGAARQMLVEGGTEGIQTAIEKASLTHADPNTPFWTNETLDDIVDSVLKGGIAGGAFGAVGGFRGTDGEGIADVPPPEQEADLVEADLQRIATDMADTAPATATEILNIPTEARQTAVDLRTELESLAAQYNDQGAVAVVELPDDYWDARSFFDPKTKQLIGIALNLSKTQTPEQARIALEHELSHAASNSGILDEAAATVSETENLAVDQLLSDLGYDPNDTRERVARQVDVLRETWSQRNWFQQMVGKVMVYANKAGFRLTRLAAENITAKAVADSRERFKNLGAPIVPEAETSLPVTDQGGLVEPPTPSTPQPNEKAIQLQQGRENGTQGMPQEGQEGQDGPQGKEVTNAPQEVSVQEGVRPEPENRTQVGETQKAGPGDSLQRPTAGLTGEEITRDSRIRRTVAEVESLAKNSEDFKDWYGKFKVFLEDYLGEHRDYAPLISEFLSATSAATSVETNVPIAIKALKEYIETGTFTRSYLPSQIPNLVRATRGEELSGPKISQYSAAVFGDTEAIPVDRHIAQLLFNVDEPRGDKLRLAKQRIRVVAERLGWTPAQTQAALWAANQRRKNQIPISYESYLNNARKQIFAILSGDTTGRGRESSRRIAERISKGGRVEGAVTRESRVPFSPYTGDTKVTEALKAIRESGKVKGMPSPGEYATQSQEVRTQAAKDFITAFGGDLDKAAEVAMDNELYASASERALQPIIIGEILASRPGNKVNEKLWKFLETEGSGGGQLLQAWAQLRSMFVPEFQVRKAQEAWSKGIANQLPQNAQPEAVDKVVKQAKRRAKVDVKAKLSPVEKAVERLLNAYAKIQKDTPELSDSGAKNKDLIKAAFLQQVAEPASLENFTDTITGLGATEDNARVLHGIAARERQSQDVVAAFKDQAKLAKAVLKAAVTGVKWRDILESHTDAQEQSRKDLLAKMQADPSFAALDNQTKLDLVNELGKLWESKRNAEIERTLKKATKEGTVTRKIKAPELIRLINSGALMDERVWNALASKFGLPTFTKEYAEELKRRIEAEQKLPVDSLQRKRAIANRVEWMARHNGIGWLPILGEVWYASVLSGLRTQVDNASSALNVITEAALTIGSNPKDAPYLMSALFRGISKGQTHFGDIFKRGDYSHAIQKEVEERQNHLQYLRNDPNPLKRVLSNWRFVPQFMAAMDTLNASASQEIRATQLAIARARDPLAPTQADFDTAYKTILATTPDQIRAATEQAQGDVDRGEIERKDLKRRRSEILEKMRPSEITDAAIAYGKTVTGNNEPTGLSGAIYRGLTTSRRLAPVMHPLMPFLRVAANLTNIITDYLPPVGLARLWFNNPSSYYGRKAGAIFNKEFAQLTPQDYQLLKAKVVLSTATWSSLLAWAMLGDSDEEKRKFDIEGPWSGLSSEQQLTLRNAGRQPYSIRIGDQWISYRNTPLAAMLASVGVVRDAQKYTKLDKKEQLDLAATSLLRGMMVVKDMSLLATMSDLLGTVFDEKVSVDRAGNFAKKFFTRSLGGFVPQLAKEIDNWFDPTLQQPTTAGEYLLKEIPIAQRAIDRPAINILGEVVKVPKYPWSRLVGAGTDSPVWKELVRRADQGVFLTAPQENRFVTLPDGTRTKLTKEQGYQYAKLAGSAYKEILTDNLEELRAMSPKEAEAFFRGPVFDAARQQALWRTIPPQ